MSFSLLWLLCWAGPTAEPVCTLEIEVPRLDVSPYHRPYVAVWLETPDRQGVHTLEIWYEQDTWLKDLRQWWRKLGRADSARYDGVTGATRKPGRYRLTWDGRDAEGRVVPAGDYVLLIEAAREEGGRDLLRQAVTLGDQAQHFQLKGQGELGSVDIHIRGAGS